MRVLAEQVAVVTGGSRGIGRAVSLALAHAGAHVAIGYLNRSKDARQVCESAGGYGVQAIAVQVDITESSQVYALIDEACRLLGPIDILVNCAGVWPVARLWEMSDAQWRRTLAVNLDGAYYACRAASAVMMKRRKGRIINFSSVAAVRGARSGHSDYAAAKGGVSALTRSLANELGPYNINVNAVAPGMIRTEMTQSALSEREHEYVAQIPLGRIGKPEDVAGVVVFLASPAASYITGQVVHVNGGMLAA